MKKDRKVRFRWGMLAVLALMLVLTACGRGDGGAAGAGLDLSGTVTGWTGASGPVNVLGYDPDDLPELLEEIISKGTVLATGSVNASGQLSLSLPVPNAAIRGQLVNLFDPSYVFSDPAALGVTALIGLGSDAATDDGDLVLADSEAAAQRVVGPDADGFNSAQLIWSDRAVSISNTENGNAADISLEPGWNFVGYDVQAGVMTERSAEFSELNWYWVEY